MPAERQEHEMFLAWMSEATPPRVANNVGATMKLTVFLLLAIATQAHAAPVGQRLYANCAACHGTTGHTVGSTLPPLAGQPKETLIAAMRAFKTGERPATIMHQIAKGYSDEQIEQIAAYLAAQKVKP
jgi:cytochrome subunit of sulfide dehydrogenase